MCERREGNSNRSISDDEAIYSAACHAQIYSEVGKLNGRPVKVLRDTGCTLMIVDRALFPKRVVLDIIGPINPPSEAGHRYISTQVDYATRKDLALEMAEKQNVYVVVYILSRTPVKYYFERMLV